MTEYIRQYQGYLNLREEPDPLLLHLKKTLEMNEADLLEALLDLLDRPLEELLGERLNELEYVAGLIVVGMKDKQ